MCCGLCCKEFKGWCNSFTRTERLFTILEAVLLAIFICFLIFLILHLLACAALEPGYEEPKKSMELEEEIIEKPFHKTNPIVTSKPKQETEKHSTAKFRSTMDPGRECSWTPSAKTTAFTHYYDKTESTTKNYIKLNVENKPVSAIIKYNKTGDSRMEHHTHFIQDDQSDGEDAEPVQNAFILSLVKLKPPQGVVFGCILSIIDAFHVLTAASCIEAIEEVDSLDSFVIMENYGTSSNGKIRAILDLQIHPFYQGTNKSYDLAIIRSESRLDGQAAELPSLLDPALITIGERFHILGFGPYRSLEAGAGARGLRRVWVYRLSAAQCPGAPRWTPRHLEAGRAAPAGRAGRAGEALCAGALYARGLPCNYCAGTPLLRARRLLALMADNQQCGAACEPQLYVNIAAHRDWIDAVLKQQ